MEYTHPCIKCKTSYGSNEPDPYYCASCDEERKKIAKEIDAKLASRPTKPVMTPLQEYDAAQKVRGFMHVRL